MLTEQSYGSGSLCFNPSGCPWLQLPGRFHNKRLASKAYPSLQDWVIFTTIQFRFLHHLYNHNSRRFLSINFANHLKCFSFRFTPILGFLFQWAFLSIMFGIFRTKMLVATFLNVISFKKLIKGDVHQSKYLLLLTVPSQLLNVYWRFQPLFSYYSVQNISDLPEQLLFSSYGWIFISNPSYCPIYFDVLKVQSQIDGLLQYP